MAKQYADDAFLLALYPEAADVAPEQRVRWLLFARGIVHLNTLEEDSDDAHAAMTMHLLALQPGSPLEEAEPQVASMALGEGSISYDVSADTDDDGNPATKYWRHYKLKRDAKTGVVWVV